MQPVLIFFLCNPIVSDVCMPILTIICIKHWLVLEFWMKLITVNQKCKKTILMKIKRKKKKKEENFEVLLNFGWLYPFQRQLQLLSIQDRNTPLADCWGALPCTPDKNRLALSLEKLWHTKGPCTSSGEWKVSVGWQHQSVKRVLFYYNIFLWENTL